LCIVSSTFTAWDEKFIGAKYNCVCMKKRDKGITKGTEKYIENIFKCE
jgi:hypothetical protein